MRTVLRMVLLLVVAIGIFSLTWAPGPPVRPTKCPWPDVCTQPCEPAGTEPVGTCFEKDGTSFSASYACCCCTLDAKHRSSLPPR